MHVKGHTGHVRPTPRKRAAGRPLFDDDRQVLPAVVRQRAPGLSLRASAAEHWLLAARMEYASVAAFSRLSAELMALQAPLHMIEDCQQASLDEVQHTAVCLSIANGLADEDEFALGSLAVVPARRDITIAELAVEALLEGCIGEGSAATWATHAAAHAQPEYASHLRVIAADELRHAGLSWRVIHWAIALKPTLSKMLMAELAAWERDHEEQPPADDRENLEHLGVLSEATEYAATSELVKTVVRPTLERLCGHESEERPTTGVYSSLG